MKYVISAAVITAFSAAQPALSADLGGSCCADFEERIAELEATTVRKGNRKVTLTVSGHVSEAIVFWKASGNQGDAQPEEENSYVGTNSASSTRFRFRGWADINKDWSAGFMMEFGVRANDLQDTSQAVSLDATGVRLRHEALYIKSNTYGTLWLGLTSSAIDGITEICLGCGIGNVPDFDSGMSSLLTESGIRYGRMGTATGFFAGEGSRRNGVRYVSPVLAGFSLSTSFGDDDYWDAALRYAGKIGKLRVAAGVGYGKETNGISAAGFGFGCTQNLSADPDRECHTIGGSASIRHVPTGLYLSGAYGLYNDDLAPANANTDKSWFLTGGIIRNWTKLGDTNVWVMYGDSSREIGQNSGLKQYGVGLEQNISSAAMDMYVYYKRFEAELNNIDDGEADQVFVGARVRF